MKNPVQSAGCWIDPAKMQVTRGQEEIKLRPKTLQLLLLLLSKPGQLITKKEMLDTIWDDVQVDEQVIFQSIKELRKIFISESPIKTIPRKGYVWIAPVTKKVTAAGTLNGAQGQKPVFWFWAATATILSLVILFFSSWTESPTKSTNISGSVLILPVKTQSLTLSQPGTRFGLMDHLIQHLQSTDSIAVLQTDYVLDVMSRAKVPLDSLSENNIEALFQVSGAALIVDISLSGNPGDYQFVYRLIRPGAQKTNTSISMNLNEGIDKVALAVTKQLGQTLETISEYPSSFSDELIASGLAIMYQKPLDALKYYDAAILSNPENITAHRLAIQTAMMAGETQKARNLLAQSASLMALSNNDIERVRLMFFSAAVYAQYREFDIAQQLLADTELLAKKQKDWLFLAYTMELKGQLAQQAQNYQEAEAHYQKALEYHDILQCPLGRSNNLVFLSKLAYQQDKLEHASALANEAAQLVNLRQLQQTNTEAIQWQQELAQHSEKLR